MDMASSITRYEDLKIRAGNLKPKLKIEIVRDSSAMRTSGKTFAIGPSRIRDFDRYLENNFNANEQDDCKVACFDTLDEIEAFILSREMME